MKNPEFTGQPIETTVHGNPAPGSPAGGIRIRAAGGRHGPPGPRGDAGGPYAGRQIQFSSLARRAAWKRLTAPSLAMRSAT